MTTGSVPPEGAQPTHIAQPTEAVEVSDKGLISTSAVPLDGLIESLGKIALTQVQVESRISHAASSAPLTQSPVETSSLEELTPAVIEALNRTEQMSTAVKDALISALNKPGTQLTAAKVIAASVASGAGALDLGLTGGALTGAAVAGVLLANSMFDIQNQKGQLPVSDTSTLATGGGNAIVADSLSETIEHMAEPLLDVVLQLPDSSTKIATIFISALTEFSTEVSLDTAEDAIKENALGSE